MNRSIQVMMLIVCTVRPLVLVAQEAGQSRQTNVAIVHATNDESEFATTGRESDLLPALQDKQNPPYDQPPEAKTTVQPRYPDLATRAGIEGTVWTKVSVDEKGKVTNVTISKSDAEILNQPSIDAAMQWEFKPALKDGKPIVAEVSIPFRFKVQKGPDVADYSQRGVVPLSVAVVGPQAGYRVMRQHPYLVGQSPSPSNNWYPESALKDKFEGTVWLKLTISLYGRAERVEVTGHAREDLDSAAVHLARTWTFIPGQANGMPEKTMISVPVNFNLGRQAK